MYREAYGREIGRTTTQQEGNGPIISTSQAKAGDLLFRGPQGGTYHVAIALGNGWFIHAPSPGGAVRIQQESQWYSFDFAVSM